MKTNKILSTAALLTIARIVVAQEQTQHLQQLKITDLYVHNGFFVNSTTNGSLQDFKTLAPQSVLLKNDLSAYSQSNGYSFDGRSMLSASLGIQLRDKNKTGYRKSPLLRLGVGYYSVSGIATNFYTTKTITYDTLKSTKSSEVTYLDSVKRKNYNMDYSANQLRLDASLIFRTNADARWSAFAGIGINAGASLNSSTRISYYETEDKEARNTAGEHYTTNYYSSTVVNSKSEIANNKTNFTCAAYVPVGVDFRIGKKRAFWKHTHLFYELRPSVAITAIPELRTFADAGVQQGIGLRVAL
jgi:hypothetical protein